MQPRHRNFFDAKFIFATLIIVAGLLLLLRNMGIIPYVNIWEWWPLVLVLIGLGHVLQPREDRQNLSGFVLIAIGGIFLLNNLDVIYFNFATLWPVFLILVGLLILKQTIWGSSKKDRTRDRDFIDLAFILGGGDYSFTSKTLQGGKVTAIMGGGTLDLREADFIEESIELELFTMWGGIEVRVPYNWNVNIQGMPLLGGMENKTSSVPATESGASTKRLVIKGMAIMGGVEVKN